MNLLTMFSSCYIIIVVWIFVVLTFIGIEPLNISQKNTGNDVDPLKKMICLQISNKTFQVVTIFEFANDIYFTLDDDHDNNNNNNNTTTNNNNKKGKRLNNTNLFKFRQKPGTISMVTTLNFSKGKFQSFDVLLELEHSEDLYPEIYTFELVRWPDKHQFGRFNLYRIEKYTMNDEYLVDWHLYDSDFCVIKINQYLLNKLRTNFWDKTKMILKSANYLHHSRYACFLFETSGSPDKLIIIYEFPEGNITEIHGVYGQQDFHRRNNLINKIQLMFSINGLLILINDQQELYLTSIYMNMRILTLGQKIFWSEFFQCESSSYMGSTEFTAFPTTVFGPEQPLISTLDIEDVEDISYASLWSEHTLVTVLFVIVILSLFTAIIVVLLDSSKSSPLSQAQGRYSAVFKNRNNKLMGIGQKTLQKRINIDKQKQMVREKFSLFNQNLLKAWKRTGGGTTSSGSQDRSISKHGFPFDSTDSFRTSDESLFTPISNKVIQSPPNLGRTGVDPMEGQFIMRKFSKTYFISEQSINEQPIN